jgi:hypothetical protein
LNFVLVQERDALHLRPLSTEGESLLTDGWQGSQKKVSPSFGGRNKLTTFAAAFEGKQNSLTDRTTKASKKKSPKAWWFKKTTYLCRPL